MNNTERIRQIESRLNREFTPTVLSIRDDSAKHAGHVGAKDGRGHFAVTISSTKFDGLSAVQCHRAIYDALGEMMQTDIHALSISIQPCFANRQINS